MKINWGTSIAIVMGLFMAFIIYFVVKAATQDANETDLVTEDYYKKEQTLQEDIYAMENTTKLATPIAVNSSKERIEVAFPEDLNTSQVEGTLYLYRPSNKKLDFEVPIKIEDGKAVVETENLVDGRWNITVNFTYNGKKYLYKKSLTL